MSEIAVYISAVIWLVCVLIWWLAGERRFASPIFLYLVFHFLTFVVRPMILLRTEDFSFLTNVIGVGLFREDHQEALLIANAALIAMLAGSLIGEALAKRKGIPRASHVLPETILIRVGIAIVAFGCFSYLMFAPNPATDPGGVRDTRQLVVSERGVTSVQTTTAYLTTAYALIAGVFLAWTAFLGFRRWWILPLGVYFLALAYVGSARTHYVLGFMAIMLIVIATQGRRWPRPGHLILAGIVLLAFLAGKVWLQTLHLEGSEIAREQATASWDSSLQGESALFTNYDMFAAATYLVPTYADHTSTTLYARPLYQWIPRAIWPNKPVFGYSAAYLHGEVQTINFRGRVVTLVGESYIAFGLAGVIIMFVIYGTVFNYIATRAYLHPAASVERVFGIAVVVCLFQVYRDGIISMQLYLMLYFGPCAVMWIISRILLGNTDTPNTNMIQSPVASPSIRRHERLRATS
jgi:oligosaccharide repeat unit polymerase